LTASAGGKFAEPKAPELPKTAEEKK
jgi:hypothetical protein